MLSSFPWLSPRLILPFRSKINAASNFKCKQVRKNLLGANVSEDDLAAAAIEVPDKICPADKGLGRLFQFPAGFRLAIWHNEDPVSGPSNHVWRKMCHLMT